MGLFFKECDVCGKRVSTLSASQLTPGNYICNDCDKKVRMYVKEQLGKRIYIPPRYFDIPTLKAIIAGESPAIELPGSDEIEDGFAATGTVGAYARYNDNKRQLLIAPLRNIEGTEVEEAAKLVSYDDIAWLALMDDDVVLLLASRQDPDKGRAAEMPKRTDATAPDPKRTRSLRLEIGVNGDGEPATIHFLRTTQNRSGFAYSQASELANFLMKHLVQACDLVIL